MYVLNIADNYDIITFTICTDNGSNIDKSIPTFLLTIPCGLPVLCLMSLMIYTSIKPLITDKG